MGLFNKIMARNFSGKNVLVMGLGHFGGGAGVSRYLVLQGANVTVTDMADHNKLASTISSLDGYDINYHLGGHVEEDFIDNALIIVNPAVEPTNKFLKIATTHGNELTSEINLFFESCPCPIIGVTGSNGKSTTTSMLAHVLTTCKEKSTQYNNVYVGGNIGHNNLLESLDAITKDDICIVELSSFQLKSLGDIKISPHIAIVTNITPNHLDWHKTLADYKRSKQNILRDQKTQDYAILCLECHALKEWRALSKGNQSFYSSAKKNHIPLTVPGHHNQTNAYGALTAAKILGIQTTDGIKALQNYQGLPHRLEKVKNVSGVAYYNDSIATTPESTLCAIESLGDRNITLILGGYDKGISYEKLINYIALTQHDPYHVNNIILIGQIKETLLALFTKKEMEDCQCFTADSLKHAVHISKVVTLEGNVVLLSPASASYDMFKNFADRGNQFKQHVIDM
jgi:UDP-N-acetylmuramoylalanine--D-glutamate ligase